MTIQEQMQKTQRYFEQDVVIKHLSWFCYSMYLNKLYTSKAVYTVGIHVSICSYHC